MIRNEQGKFVKGNPGNKNAPGRPPRPKEEKYLKSMFARVSITDWRAIVDRAIQDAKRGDNQARKWLSDYLLGSPLQRQEITGAEGGKLIVEVEYINSPIAASDIAPGTSED